MQHIGGSAVVLLKRISDVVMAIAVTLPWQANLNPCPSLKFSRHPNILQRRLALPRRQLTAQAFQRSDFDGFTQRVASGEELRRAWRRANDGIELLRFEAKKVAERIDRRYAVSRRLSSLSRAAGDYARDMDREFEIGRRFRNLSLDLSRNWPTYRKQLTDFFNTPLGRSFATIFFLWFALSGWMFRCLIFGTWILPFAGPLLIGAVANNLVIKGTCPACKRQFVGYKTQIIQCTGCGNVVWQPKGDIFSRRNTPSGSEPDIIDVEFEEK